MAKKEIELVVIKNSITGHEIPIQKRAWENSSRLYKGYHLVTDDSELEYFEKVSEENEPETVTDNIEEATTENKEQEDENKQHKTSKKSRKNKDNDL